MDGTTFQARVYGGYAKAAARIGLPFDVYRPSGGASPLAAGNRVAAALPAHFTPKGAYSQPNGYGQATWQAMVDGGQVMVGDYLVGASGTYFVAARQPLLPILAVSCTRTLSLTQGGTAPVAVGWPASVLIESTRGNDPLEDLAGNPAAPHWWCLMPAVPGVTPNVADLVTDDLLRSYIVDAAELTPLGWRISMAQTTQLTDSVIQHYSTIIGLVGKVIALRQVTAVGVTAAAAAAGATSLTLTGCPGTLAGIAAGDTITDGGWVYVATNAVAAVAGTIAGVAIAAPGLGRALPAAAALGVRHAVDYSVKALIGGYERSLINGTAIQVADLRVVVATTTTAGTVLPVPATTNFLVIDGVQRSIIAVKPEYAGDQVAIWECQARG